jgi:hypothetical protein
MYLATQTCFLTVKDCVVECNALEYCKRSIELVLLRRDVDIRYLFARNATQEEAIQENQAVSRRKGNNAEAKAC